MHTNLYNTLQETKTYTPYLQRMLSTSRKPNIYHIYRFIYTPGIQKTIHLNFLPTSKMFNTVNTNNIFPEQFILLNSPLLNIQWSPAVRCRLQLNCICVPSYTEALIFSICLISFFNHQNNLHFLHRQHFPLKQKHYFLLPCWVSFQITSLQFLTSHTRRHLGA